MALLLMLFSTVLVLVIILTVSTIIKLRFRKEKYKKQGVPYLVRFREYVKILCGVTNLVDFEEAAYQQAVKCNTPLVIHSDFGGDIVVLMDLELIKGVLVKDFDHFVNGRTFDTQNSNKYFKKMLFSMVNEQWKVVRTKLSPSFSTGRIRRMFQIFHQSSGKMSSYLKDNVGHPTHRTKDLDMSQILSKFTLEVISCAFGIDSRSFEYKPQELSVFEYMAKRLTVQMDFKSVLKFTVLLAAPKLGDMLGMDVMDSESQAYFAGVVKEVIKRRRETGEKRDDFLQLMLEAQQGLLKAEEETSESRPLVGADNLQHSETKMVSDAVSSAVTLDDDDVIANAMLFILAGFDNTLSILLFALYNLALAPDVQQKLHEEITRAVENHNGEMSYDAISEMTFLDCIIHESMRLYPPTSRTERTCTKDYPVPGTSFVIPKDTVVAIPLLGIHRDPRYYPEPHKFIPERFTQENKAKRHAYSYLPFGLGPRSCIATRFAILEAKTVFAQLVRDFTFEPCAKTLIPMQFGPDATIKPKGGLWLSVTCRD